MPPPTLLVARCGSPWIRNKGCGRSQPVTAKLRNAGGESPPQMKPLNYHAINMQTSAKLGLNQISHWGLSGGGESGRRGAHQGGLQKEGGWLIEKRVSVRPRHPRATQRPLESGVGPCFPLRGARVYAFRLPSSGGF